MKGRPDDLLRDAKVGQGISGLGRGAGVDGVSQVMSGPRTTGDRGV